MYKFNRQHDPNMYVHILPGTGSYTTRTTNMHNKDRFHVRMSIAHDDIVKRESCRGGNGL
jgi:hypothetical protein